MTNLIRILFKTGVVNLTVNVIYDNAGTMTAREIDVPLTEEPANSSVYVGSPNVLISGDIVVVYEGGAFRGGREYEINVALETTIADDNPDGSSSDQTFILADGSGSNDEYNSMIVSVTDITGNVVASRRIVDYTGANKKIEVDSPFEFPLAIGDKVRIWADTYSQTATVELIDDIVTAIADILPRANRFAK